MKGAALAASAALAALLAAGCTRGDGTPATGASPGPGPAERPSYEIEATVDPEGGAVRGKVTVQLPARDRRTTVPFRVFPNDPRLDAGFVVTGGDATDDDLHETILSVSRGQSETVTLAFEYTLPELRQGSLLDLLMGGNALAPDAIGVLGRHRNGVALGHWFPAYLPEGVDSEPDVRGFGDLGNFPAASFRARLRVPSEWQLTTSGVSVGRSREGGFTTYEERGSRLRDFAVYVGRDLETAERTVDGVTIRAWAHAEHAGRLRAVTATAGEALRLFNHAFGRYPWPELDVVDTPLGLGVGGMEWPAMVWIGSDAFAGDIPGMGALGSLLGARREDPLRNLLDNPLVRELGLAPVVAGLDTTPDFVLVHEVAHQWWSALVGSDSLAAPMLDEPLAQYSGCLFWRERRPRDAEAACTTNVTGQYTLARSLGTPDAPADQPSDRFDSSLQYGAVVYGKAPAFYLKLEELLGRRTLVRGLQAYVRAQRFRIATDDDLLRALAGAAPRHAESIRRLWTRWMRETHGDDDLGATGGEPGSLRLEPIVERLLDELARRGAPGS